MRDSGDCKGCSADVRVPRSQIDRLLGSMAGKGFKLVDDGTYASRFAVCRACPSLACVFEEETIVSWVLKSGMNFYTEGAVNQNNERGYMVEAIEQQTFAARYDLFQDPAMVEISRSNRKTLLGSRRYL